MKRIAIIFILLGSLCLVSGCLEVSYKTEVRATLGNMSDTRIARPRIVDDGYPNSPRTVNASLVSNEQLYRYNESRPIISEKVTEPKRRGFKKFKRREK